MTDIYAARRAVLAEPTRGPRIVPRPNDQKVEELLDRTRDGQTVRDALASMGWSASAAEIALRKRGIRDDLTAACHTLAREWKRAHETPLAPVTVDRIIRRRLIRLSTSTDPDAKIRASELRLLQAELTRKAAS